MSRAASARYRVACRVCHAAPGDPCRTLTTGRVTDTHADRLWLASIPPRADMCVCGNAFDGDNLCMPSACQWEV